METPFKEHVLTAEKPRISLTHDKMRILASFAFQGWAKLNPKAQETPEAWGKAIELRNENLQLFPKRLYNPSSLTDEDVRFFEANLRGHSGHDDILILAGKRGLDLPFESKTSYNSTLIDRISYQKP
ncbi:MAG: hypothetical protein Q8P25_04805 [Candidatus Curtissbacteria bacterium]|nr:hypothetical protein [Candidatus Curtissbacteria bacterium]